MEQIESFKVDHNNLYEGIYVSRRDGDVTTYDLRTRRPNMGDYMDNVTMHSVEHMLATFLRNSDKSENVIYFGPMGCRTGFYLLTRGLENDEVLSLLVDCLEKTIAHSGEVFGASARECGNYRELSLESAKDECRRYLNILNSKEQSFKYEE